MIKLKVVWHLECQSCGTELITDFFESDGPEYICPWCGCRADEPADCSDTGLRSGVQSIQHKLNIKTLS